MKTFVRWSAVAFVLVLAARSVLPDASSAAAGWEPKRTIEFVVTSAPGGGSDLYARTIADLMKKKGMVKPNVIVNNQTDGGGEVGRSRVAMANDDQLLLAFMSGAIAGMLQNTKMTMDNFTPLAMMASDKHLLFAGQQSKYKNIREIIDAAKAGTTIIVGGSKTDDVSVFEMFLAETGISPDVMTYIMYDSTSEAITGILGGHLELCIGKPAATIQYVKSGKMTPVLAFSTSRFEAPFDQVPVLSEIGYKNVEFPLWRGVVGPKNMSAAAVAFWDGVLAKVSDSPEWKAYMDKNMLVPMYMNAADAKKYITGFEAELKASTAKK